MSQIANIVAGLLTTAAVLLSGGCGSPANDERVVEGGDAQRGRIALRQHQCGVCHVIPGVRSATGRVGPTLAEYSRFTHLAGKFPQEPERLVQWIVDAPSLAPQTAMPAMTMSEQEARDMAAYLYSLD